MERICVLCGKTFTTKSSRRAFCYEDHFHPCPICGKPVLTKDLQHLEECCCSKHSHMKVTRTIHETYDEWPTNTEEAKAKRKQTNLERWGTDNPAKNEDIKKKVSDGLHKRYAIDGKDIRKRAAQTYFDKTGYYYPAQNPEVIEKVKQDNLKKYGCESAFDVPEFKEKAKKTNLERWGTEIPMQNHEVWAKQRSQKSKYHGCDGTPLDSSYEVIVYDYCVRNQIPIQRTYPIQYEYEGESHKTFIDFVIDGLLVEVKGEHGLQGYYDSQPGAVPIARKLEIYKQNNVIVITGDTMKHMFRNSKGLKYQKDALIGVDLKLFDNPEFPYAPNRPKCFYDVKVGPKSCYEAFNDEKIRWEMIKNRIQYMGGFISSKEILTALNVTKTYRQPSWFAKSYAEYLLKKYSISDTIVDPFAGWGMRHDAARALYKNYIGCDLNPELVEWHQDHNRSITLGDAREFKYDGECDVFICPPYSHKELYLDSQQNLTECQWLEIVRKNVPKAKRYIMVCKQVDPGYEQFIKETKTNKSHFGTNYESVIVIENS